MKHKALQNLGVLLFWLIVWQVVAMIVNNPILFVTPFQMVKTLLNLLQQFEVWVSIFKTCSSVVLGFLLAFVGGFILAYLSYKHLIIQHFIAPIIATFKAIPVASFIVIVLVWSSSAQLSLIISTLIGLPLVYTILLEGFNTIDVKLLEMANVFNVSSLKQFKHITLSEIAPFLYSGVQVTLGYCFKSGIAAEVIGLPLHSLGAGLYQAKVYFATDELFAYTALIIGLSYLLEKTMVALVRLIYQKGGYYD